MQSSNISGNSRYAVIGAGSFLGQCLINCWRETDSQQVRQVCAIVNERNREAAQALKSQGVQVHQTNYSDESKISEIVRNCRYAIICPPTGASFTRDDAMRSIRACKSANVNNMVVVSLLGVDASGAGSAFKSSYELEEQAKKQFERNAVLRITLPAQFFDFYAPVIQERNKLAMNTGHGRVAPVDLIDVAKALSHMVKNESLDRGQVGQVFQLTGPQAYNGNEIAECIRKATNGRQPSSYESVNRQELERELHNIYSQQRGKVMGSGGEIPSTISKKPSLDSYKHTIQLLLDYGELVQKNELNQTTKDLYRLTHSEPTPLEKYFKRQSDVWALSAQNIPL